MRTNRSPIPDGAASQDDDPLSYDRRDSGPSLHAAWALLLPVATHVLTGPGVPPALVAWWRRHGVRVSTPEALSGAPDVDLLVSWASGAQTGASPPPRLAPACEHAVWTQVRGPLEALRRLTTERAPQGWRRHGRLFAWPGTERLRQIVPQQRWRRTPRHVHRRSHGWKRPLLQSPLGMLACPAWLTRCRRTQATPRPSWLDEILAAIHQRLDVGAEVADLRLSPNGVAIVFVAAPGGRPAGILKVPLTPSTLARVENNARALTWMQEQATAAGHRISPRLLASGRTQGALWTLEEHVAGTEAQTWPRAAARQAVRHVAGLLGQWQRDAAHPVDPLAGTASRHLQAVTALLPAHLAQGLQECWRRTVRNLADVRVPRVPQHGDCKLENVLGRPDDVANLRLLDWELWTPDGLPLLDLLHLLLSRHRRECRVSIGGSICRWLLDGELDSWELQLLDEQARGLDRRYVAALPLLYWLERVGPVAACGSWPGADWTRVNVEQVLDRLTQGSAEVLV